MRPGADAEHPWRSPVAEFDRDELFVRPDWQKRAACRGLGPTAWFPPRGAPHAGQEARAICATCPVQDLMEPADASRPQCAEGPSHMLGRHMALAFGDNEIAATRRVYRLAHQGLTAAQADALAVSLGRHPGTIWDEWWWLGVEAS